MWNSVVKLKSQDAEVEILGADSTYVENNMYYVEKGNRCYAFNLDSLEYYYEDEVEDLPHKVDMNNKNISKCRNIRAWNVNIAGEWPAKDKVFKDFLLYNGGCFLRTDRIENDYIVWHPCADLNSELDNLIVFHSQNGVTYESQRRSK